MDKGGEYPLVHDLNFQSNRYEAKHTIVSSYSSPVGRGVVSLADAVLVISIYRHSKIQRQVS